jgi:hypothetical protein
VTTIFRLGNRSRTPPKISVGSRFRTLVKISAPTIARADVSVRASVYCGSVLPIAT